MSKKSNITALKKGEIVARNMTLLTLLLSTAKGIIGFLSGSIALIADAIHGLVDTLAIFASWFGLKISQRNPDETFPYGYYKAENLITLLISLIIAYTSYEIFKESIVKFHHTPQLNIPFWALSISLISSILAYFIYSYEKNIGNEINSSSLLANADESKTDIYSSLLVFISILASYFNIKYIESIAGIILAIMILKIAIENSKIAIYSLMDAIPNKQIYNKIKLYLETHPKISNLKSLKLRQSGPFIFGEATITLSSKYNLEESHKITEEIESELKDLYPEIDSFIIHTEPEQKTIVKALIPIKYNYNKDILDQEISDRFASSPNYLLITYDKSTSNIIRTKVIDIKDRPKIKKGLFVSKKLLKYRPDLIITKQIGDVSKSLFKGHNTKIKITKAKKIKSILSLI